MRNLARNLLRDNGKKLLGNFFSLSAIQVLNTALPLLTIPYLNRILGTNLYGTVLYAWAVVQYGLVLTEYGLDQPLTRQAALLRDDSRQLSELFSAVLGLRVGLAALAWLLLTAWLWLRQTPASEVLLYQVTFGLVVGSMFDSAWFYKGHETMHYLTWLSFGASITQVLLLLLLVRSPSDYLWVAGLASVVSLGSGLVSLVLVLQAFGVRLRFSAGASWLLLKSNFHFFLSSLVLSLYTLSGAIIVGALYAKSVVAWYVITTRIIRILRMPFFIADGVLYPHLSRTRQLGLYTQLIPVFGGVAVLYYGVVFFWLAQ